MMTEHIDRHTGSRDDLVRRAEREVGEWVEAMAHVGDCARGFVCVAAGILAAAVALGYGGRSSTHMGALGQVTARPLGQFLLIVLAMGLFACTVWCVVRAAVDPAGRGGPVRAVSRRLVRLMCALLYAAGGVAAALLSQHHQWDGVGVRVAVTTLLEHAYGVWLVGAAAAVLVAYGMLNLRRAYHGGAPD